MFSHNSHQNGEGYPIGVKHVAIISVHACPSARLGSKDTGGMNVYIRRIATEMSQRGIYVDIYTRQHDITEPQIMQISELARVIHLNAGDITDDKSSVVHHLPSFASKILEFAAFNNIQYDLIHSHYWLSGIVATTLSNNWDIPQITSFHTLAEIKKQARVGEYEPPQRTIGEESVIRSADSIVAFSTHERDALVRFYGASHDRIAVIPCGVDPKQFKPTDQEQAKRVIGVQTGKIVLYVGRLEPLKGVHILLEAIAQIDHSEPINTLIVGGDNEEDPEMLRLQQLSHDLGISNSVKFLGTIAQEQLPTYYNAADICVMPSYYESFGLVALEAMACGTPVIASRVGGIPTVVKDMKTGYLVKWRRPEPFADGLEVLLKSPYILLNMGQAARDVALTMTWSVVVDKLLDVYQRTIIQRHNPG